MAIGFWSMEFTASKRSWRLALERTAVMSSSRKIPRKKNWNGAKWMLEIVFAMSVIHSP
jgi:hypothetical protein